MKWDGGMTSDMMHNHNCFVYLLQLKPFINKKILKILPELVTLFQLDNQYNPLFPYGNLYSSTINYLEEQIDSLASEQLPALDKLIFAIYHNNNRILENTEWINKVVAQTRPLQVNTKKRITLELADNKRRVNNLSPEQAESLLNRAIGLFSSDFKPQHATNIPSLKNFSYKNAADPVEYRFSTQAQRHHGLVRISPLFRRWLAINAQSYPDEQPICHIYFNNLGLDRDDLFDIPGVKEKQLSLALHELEKDPSLKVAIITLPASQSLMDSHEYHKTEGKWPYAELFQEFLNVAQGNKHPSGISDLYISPQIKKRLFTDPDNELTVLKTLLQDSFNFMGIDETQLLSSAQKQAVWLHFIKFELTDYIIKKLTRDNEDISYNFSCKDAIDRGALSSIYYNLLKSFQVDHPMQRSEFERALDAGAATVKGRGMNFHRNIIWNAIDSLVNANYDDLLADERKSWLIYWRDMNCPHSRVEQLMTIRLNQCKEQLYSLSTDQLKVKNIGLKLLSQIQEQYSLSGQRLLLEVISRTSLMVYATPTPDSAEAYKNLAMELRINHPVLHLIGGLMEVLLGALLYLPSLGYSQSFITKGLATAKSGFFAAERNQLSDDLLEFATQPNSSLVIA